MPENLTEILSNLVSAAAGAGLTILVVAKFGENIFFRHLDHKYSERLSERNIELQAELEETKNILNRSLQQDVAAYKAELEITTSQRSRYLERKIDSILELNKQHVVTITALLSHIEKNHTYIEEAANYFILQTEEEGFSEFSDYAVYEDIVRKYWPKTQEPAEAAINKYSESLALRMPILPMEFSLSELNLISDLEKIMTNSKMLFYRTMGLTSEIVNPEEGMTAEECLSELKSHVAKSLKIKRKVEQHHRELLKKAQESSLLIESLLTS